jgi:hypothetical protein
VHRVVRALATGLADPAQRAPLLAAADRDHPALDLGHRVRHGCPTSQLNALEAESLTRRHWQVLNTIAHGARTPEDLDAALAPFGSIAAQLAEVATGVSDDDHRTTIRTLERCAANLEAA